VVVDGAAHSPHTEAPEEFAAAVQRFLRDVERHRQVASRTVR
jgi:pimeloyl-ACP methyl ester carboxylesterase